jgi:very-short-patch-repair endonuclease
MKICWKNLDKLKYSKKIGKWRGKTTYIYVDSCKNCNEPFLKAEKSIGEFCSLSCSTKLEYNGMYGKKRIMSSVTKERMRKSKIGKKFSEQRKTNISKSLKNRTISDEHKEKIRRFHTGGKHSDIHKEKIKNSMINRFKENPELHPNRLLAGNRKSWTFPEKLLAKWLDNNNITYEYNKKIIKYYPDFTINKTIIEVDGKQWHDKEKDNMRDNEIRKNGYTIFRIPANQIINNIDKSMAEVEKWLS